MSYDDHRCSQVVTDTQRKVKNRSGLGERRGSLGFRKRLIWRRQARSASFRGFCIGVPNFWMRRGSIEQYHCFWGSELSGILAVSRLEAQMKDCM